MPEPSASMLATGAGIALFGVALGLHPEHLVAGFCGSMWSLLLCDPMPAFRRVSIAAISTFVAGYGTPAVVALALGMGWWPETITGEIVQYPIALLIGLGTHRAGPILLKIANKMANDLTK